MTPTGIARPLGGCCLSGLENCPISQSPSMLGIAKNLPHNNVERRSKDGGFSLSVFSNPCKSKFSSPIKAIVKESSQADNRSVISVGKSTNIKWHECSIGKIETQKLIQQKGCVLWLTGLSGSGKSTVANALSQLLYNRGKLSYILDGDNVRHGLNKDLSFAAEDRAENIRRVGEVAKLFADAGIICIASLISPYRRDRDACRAIMTGGNFIEVFMDVPLEVCESRDPKGLYNLARAGKIKGFTGIDDPYEPPLNSEIVLEFKGASPVEMAEKVMSYLEENGYLHA